MQLLYSYLNGNSTVELYDDGTRIRTFEGESKCEFPSSCDVKITDYCDVGCGFCHEKSTIKGKHGDLNKLFEILKVLPAGCELAIGGGSAQSHPDIIPFLKKLKEHGFVSNITINQKHLKQDKELILNLINDKLIYGIGISYSDSSYLEYIEPILSATNNVVFHTIMGLNNVSDIEELYDFCNFRGKICKVLVLGYKQYGFGLNYYLKNKSIEGNKYQWYIGLAKLFKTKDLILSFDNLAIDQMNLKRYFTNDGWQTFYQGNDGINSMFVDGVKQEFAKSSTNKERIGFDKTNLIDFFKGL